MAHPTFDYRRLAKVPGDLRAILDDVAQDPDAWLITPNPQLGNRPPIEVIEAGDGHKVADLLRAVDGGLF